MRIISGGQSGVDRAALDVAIDLGFPHGGWVPNGRTAEDGVIEAKYHVTETPNSSSQERTEWNIRDSNATLILIKKKLIGGTELTWHVANEMGRPVLLVELQSTNPTEVERAVERVREWLARTKPQVLNIAGPRESDVAIYEEARTFLEKVLAGSDFDGATTFLFEQAYANFRHWDQIRWLVPYWFATIIAGSFAVLATNTIKEPLQKYGFFGLAVFAALCLCLMLNLMRYHRIQMASLGRLTKGLTVPASIKAELIPGLPFSFSGFDTLKTATFWFMATIFFIGLGSLVGAFLSK
jgi:hypothetical protein